MMESQAPEMISQKEIDHCLKTLASLGDDPELWAHLSQDQRIQMMKLAGNIARPEAAMRRRQIKALKKKQRNLKREQNRQARATTGIRQARETPVFSAPLMIGAPDSSQQEAQFLSSPRNCYVCKAEFTQLHFFYDTMCPDCADFNYKKRFQNADLRGQVALITGSRLKIGYQATLMLLKAGATVIATTRFPADSALRFSQEKDYDQWGDRLHIYGLDLRHTPSVEIFCSHVEQTYDRLDILINNAAQTVRRPPGFYAHLMENENKSIQQLPKKAQSLMKNYQDCLEKLYSLEEPREKMNSALPVSWEEKSPGLGLRESAKLSQIPYSYDHTLPSDTVFPKGQLDVDLQQVDLRKTNSWRLKLGQVPTAELLEIQLVNAIAPFVLCNNLAAMMKRENTGKKHIVNVSAMEGKFMRFKKEDRHPHTNMAKAALNMLTHTSAGEFAGYGIFMNAVDTGWVTDEDPAHLSRFKEEIHDFQPPLDIVDGAARVCDPIFDGINTGKHWSGKFLKDYFPIDW